MKPYEPKLKTIFCTGCQFTVEARLTDGAERYPHRPDLSNIPFWHCDSCGAWVGCHHKTKQRTKPLGYLALPELFKARVAIHDIIDPLWKSDKIKRGQIYAHIAKKLGYQYHTGELRSLEEARTVYKIVAELHNELLGLDKDWKITK